MNKQRLQELAGINELKVKQPPLLTSKGKEVLNDIDNFHLLLKKYPEWKTFINNDIYGDTEEFLFEYFSEICNLETNLTKAEIINSIKTNTGDDNKDTINDYLEKIEEYVREGYLRKFN